MKRYGFFLLVMSAVLAACSGNTTGEAAEEQEVETLMSDTVVLTDRQIETVGISLGQVTQRRLDNLVRVNGRLELNPQDKAEVASLVGGIIRKITVTEGQQVSAGQVVALLENTDIVTLQKDALIAGKEAALALAEKNRQELLAEQGAGVEKTRQQAEVEYEVANARLQGLRRQLEQLGLDPQQAEHGHISNTIPVKSPIQGTVGRINVSTGSYVDIQTPMMYVANTRAVYCDLDVFDKDIESVQVGQTVDLRHSSLSRSDLQGTVTQINATLDPETRSLSVHVRLDGQDQHTLVPGMYVNGVIHTGSQLCDAVPSEAVVSSEGHDYIFVKAGDNTFVRTEVVTGAEELGYIQITTIGDDLADEAEVVVKGAYYISSMLGDHGEEE